MLVTAGTFKLKYKLESSASEASLASEGCNCMRAIVVLTRPQSTLDSKIAMQGQSAVYMKMKIRVGGQRTATKAQTSPGCRF